MTSFRGHLLTLVGVAGVVIALLMGMLTVTGAAPWTGGSYTVKALFPSAASMGPGASVRIAGLKVGRVESVERRGTAAVVTVKVSDAETPLPEDTSAAIRQRTLVGENYVELVPGTSKSSLPSGGMLALSEDRQFVDADQILTVLRGDTRRRAREMIQGLGGALDGQGTQLNLMLRHTSGVVRAADDLTAILDKDRQQVATLVQRVGDVMQAIGDRSASIKSLSRSGRTTFEALAARDEGLRATLRELPPTLSQVRDTSQLVESVTASSAPVVTRLAGALEGLRPTIAALRPAAEEGRGIMRDLDVAAPRLTKTAGALEQLGDPAQDAMPELRKTLCQLNPMAAYLSPYARDLTAMVSNMGSTTNYYDATGHAARFYALVGQNSFTAIPDAGREALNTLQEIGVVNQLTARGYNPIPKPGDVGIPSGGEGASGPLDSELPYPRVKKEC